MSTATDSSALVTVWNAQRAFVVDLGRALHASLPGSSGQVSLHGRDLRPDDEGVGGQFQYRLTDASGGPGPACFVVDVALKRGRTTLLWDINAVSVAANGATDFTIVDRRSFALPVIQRSKLRSLFDTELAQLATNFLRTWTGQSVTSVGTR